jgi:hypothetical protein
MISFLESFLRSCSADQVTSIFLVVTIGIFILAVIFNLARKYEKFTGYVPVLLTSVGILGTFIGISIGLVNFDTENIDGSISELLGGMKTAFFTSLFGMSFSILFKIFQSFLHITENKTENSDDPLKVLSQQASSLKSLISSVGGESDTSILSQLKLLRSDINDNSKSILKIQKESGSFIQNLNDLATAQKISFKEFSDKLFVTLRLFVDMLSKSATETIIDALRQVIVDFNKNLTEQFGENFKEFNDAVRELIIWQDNYKEQIRQMIEQYKLGVTALSATEASVRQISEDTQSIPSSMDKLNSIMQVNQHQLNELENHLSVFKDIRDKAVEAVPVINEQINTTIQAIAASVDSATRHYSVLLQESDGYIQKHTEASQNFMNKLIAGTSDISKTLQEANQNLIKEMNNTQVSVIHNIESLQSRLEAALEAVFSAHTQNMRNVFSSIDVGLKGQVEKTGTAVEKQLGMIDQAMQEEVNRVMNAMGNALGRISNQFVSDYSKLVNQMNEIVSVHRN